MSRRFILPVFFSLFRPTLTGEWFFLPVGETGDPDFSRQTTDRWGDLPAHPGAVLRRIERLFREVSAEAIRPESFNMVLPVIMEFPGRSVTINNHRPYVDSIGGRFLSMIRIFRYVLIYLLISVYSFFLDVSSVHGHDGMAPWYYL